jgi:uncharacterized membrane protein YtjA (UPF0391 family)
MSSLFVTSDGEDGKQTALEGQQIMLRWALIFLVIALIAGVLGFGGIAAGAAEIAKIIFIIFIILFLIGLVMHVARGRRV